MAQDGITGTAETIAGDAVPSGVLGHYRIERLLGWGGAGDVFLAYDTKLQRRVALKLLKAGADDAASSTRLLREARNAAALSHPNICTVYEVGEASGRLFIAMEHVGGGSVRERIDAGSLTAADTLRIGNHVADALAHAHEHGVTHRDLKAANAMLTEDGRVKLVDFGLARRTERLLSDATLMASAVQPGIAAGTPYAMAPEQVRGEPADERTDIWALGVLLYEMLTSEWPFRAPTVPQLFASILTARPLPLPDTVPEDLRGVIERCLEKDPERRFSNAREVAAALVEVEVAAPRALWPRALGRPRTAAALGAFVAVAALGAWQYAGIHELLVRSGAAAPIKLAVLPFENLTGDPEQDYLSDGLTEELITQLGRVHPQGLRVIARTSSMRYKGLATPVAQIGLDLDVGYLLEGSARREGDRVRINATLIQVSDQTQRWADSYDRPLTGVLALQHDVARGVAEALALELLPAERARLAVARAVDVDAYDAYQRGMSLLERDTEDTREAALRAFELALERDPTYAPAYLGIRQAWEGLQQSGFVRPEEATPKMEDALDRALELDDTQPDAHYARARQATWTEWDWAAAERSFRRTIDLNPSHGLARAFYSHYLHIMQRPDEAMAQLDVALELDPLNPAFHGIAGGAYLMARRHDEALAHFRETLRLSPGSLQGLIGVANALHYSGRFDEALAAERELAAAGRGDPELAAALVVGNDENGYRGAMRRAATVLATRESAEYVSPMRVARYYLRAGENGLALDWLERSYDARNPSLPYISSGHQDFDAVRDDPRFHELLRRMGLPPYAVREQDAAYAPRPAAASGIAHRLGLFASIRAS